MLIVSHQSISGKDIAKVNPDSITIVRLNFKDKTFSGINALDKIKRGGLYQFQIDGINQNLFKVSIQNVDTIIKSDIVFPTFDLMNVEVIGDILSKLSQITMSTGFIPNLVLGDLGGYKSNQEWINEIDVVFKNNDKAKGVINERIDLESYNLKRVLNRMRSCNLKIENLSIDVFKKILSYSVLDKEQSYYKQLSGDLTIDSIITKSVKMSDGLLNLSDSTVKRQLSYNEFMSQENIKKLINSDEKLKKANQLLIESFSETLALLDKSHKNIDASKVSGWLKTLVNAENHADTEYKSLPLQLNGDITSLKLSITPRDDASGLQSYQTEIHFPQRKEFYVGLGVSFYNAGFKNEAYSTSAVKVDSVNTNYSIIDEKGKRGEFGVSTLIHFGWRPFIRTDYDWFAVNLVTGPAFSLTNIIKPRLSIGGGFAFGRKQLLSLNLLYMMGYVDKKSEAYSLNGIFDAKPENITVSKMDGALGISIGCIYKF